ncbi:hypothetical protein JZ751_013756 [Albula glossodonta]|uniref:Uncharacterized protein n=1 Tax=Albula glossodonta TaxID=121402 RepID=A0A8T2NVP4_9TELE|nr:hypothetical protein JZ751_013756 [Albula glossodonta]
MLREEDLSTPRRKVSAMQGGPEGWGTEQELASPRPQWKPVRVSIRAAKAQETVTLLPSTGERYCQPIRGNRER